MKNIIKNISLGLLMSLPLASFGQASQYMCNGVVQDCIYNKKDGYVYNQQSQSGAFEQGDTSEVTIVVYKNMDYRISVCCPDYQEMDGKLKFKITESIKEAQWQTKMVTQTVFEEDENGNSTEKQIQKEVKKRVFKEVKVVRYDGYKEEMATDFAFISDKGRKLNIEVYVPEVGGEGGDLEAGQIVCVGLLIEHRPAPKNLNKFGK